MKNSIMITVAMLASVIFGADPGGYPGLLVAKFNAAYDTTSDICANAYGRVYQPIEMYAGSLPSYVTYGWTGYMWMEEGVTYNFKGCYDDFTTVKINGNWVIARGKDCEERQGYYTPARSDWFPVEFRVGNNGGVGGCQNSSQYGILWNTSQDSAWRRIGACVNGCIFKTGETTLKKVSESSLPYIVSSSIRANDPTILDVQFIVLSDSSTVKVRALAFQDGERSFQKVVRPETFVKDLAGNETAQNIGDDIAANVPHNLSWKVSSDWSIDLAKVSFEILVADMAVLPLKVQHIKSTGRYPALTIAVNEQKDEDIYNALLWYYADGVDDLINNDGYVDATYGYSNQIDTTVHRFVNRTTINNRMEVLRYIYAKMGWEPLEGGNLLSYVRRATRNDLRYNSSKQNAVVLSGTKPANLYVGDRSYLVIDISGGTNAETYPITYLDSEPVGGWSNEYKRDKIILRRIPAAAYNMGITVWTSWTRNRWKNVTLTRDYYMGVFTITQRQYELVMGTDPTPPSYKGETRPAGVSWNDIRGDSSVYDWPNVQGVDGASFMGRLRAKTGLKFDLPTMAQWQYACRAGTESDYNNGGNAESDLKLCGRAWTDQSLPVGSFIPNTWGLYDMHGNVGQWCLDKGGEINADPVVDPMNLGSDSDPSRVFCGLSPRDNRWHPCTSSYYTLSGTGPGANTYKYSQWIYLGFRLCLIESE